ncbi:MAG: tetratricopeptide repeat protein [Promethearchaeota archaeon]
MSHPELKQLTQAEHLFEAGRLDEAHELLSVLEKNGNLSIHDKIFSQLLRTDFLYQQGQYNEVLMLAGEIYNESLELDKILLSVDALIWMTHALIFLNRLDKAEDIIRKGEELLKTLSKKASTGYKQREANLIFVKALFYEKNDEVDKALDCMEQSLELREDLGIKHEIAYSLSMIAYILIKYKGELERASLYAERGLTLAKNTNKKFYIAFSLHSLASVYTIRGEFDQSIKIFEQSLSLYKELNNKRMIAVLLNNVGEKYRIIGELDSALDCLEQSLAIHQELGNLRDIACTHDFLIQILIDKGEIQRAQLFLHNLKQLNDQLKNKQINLIYLFDTALLLKTNLRARNRVKAEEIFNQLLEDKDLDYELTIRTLINLCELHLTELSMINDVELLNEINPLIVRLLELAENFHSYWILSETYLLQAKLSLLTFDMKKAQWFLTQAQNIADTYGIKQLGMKISYEYDKLVKQLKDWENLKELEASLPERLKLAGLKEQIETMVKNRITEVPELSDEIPVYLLIVSEGGIPLFSHSFIKEKDFASHLFGGFLTTINYFIKETFSEGLERAIFGEHSLLMKFIQPFIISYIYKGDSYYAHQKIKFFAENIQFQQEIWRILIKSLQLNQSLELKDIPRLESLIIETFMTKSKVFSDS